MKYYIEIDERDIDRFRIDAPCKGSHGNDVLVLEDKYHRTIGFELLKERPHGEWIDHSDEGYVECPFCGSATNCEDNIDDLHYCFFCGAKMWKEGEVE